jgi:hypothetical protein
VRHYVPLHTITRYRQLWLRLMDMFPTVMMDMEQDGQDKLIIQYESFRYRAVAQGSGYMTWSFPSSPKFWEKAVLPILAEYSNERMTWSTHRYNPRVFLVKMVFTPDEVQDFRDWAKSGSTNTEESLDYAARRYETDWPFPDDDDFDYYVDYDDDLANEEAITKEVEEKFERKAKRK